MLAQTITAPKPASAPPAAQPPALPANAGAPSFAQLLTDQTSLPTPTAPAAAASDAQDATVADAEPPAPTQTAARRAAAQPAKPATPPRPADGPAKAEAKTASADEKQDAMAIEAGAAHDLEDDAPETPELKEFTQLIGMATPQADAATLRPDSARHRAAASGTGKDGDDKAQGRMGLKAVADDRNTSREAPDAASKPTDLRADKPNTRPASDALQMTTQPADTEPALPTAAAPAAPSFAATLAQAQALPTPGTLPADTAARPSYADLQAPLHSAAFAPELGARVSLMAVDGVQQAQLQLNPAEMGPVSVQIVVDGGQAQVSFHAAQAETRQALEQSLPDLAAALQGQGLTLSGGGVFQQAQRDADGAGQSGRDDTQASGRGGGGVPGSTAATGSLAAPPRRTVGLLDTFA